MSEFTKKDEMFLNATFAMVKATSLRGVIMFSEADEDDKQMLEKALGLTRDDPSMFWMLGIPLLFLDPEAKRIMDEAVENYRRDEE